MNDDLRATGLESKAELTLADIEITDLHTEDALGIPELGATYCTSCVACCTCCIVCCA